LLNCEWVRNYGIPASFEAAISGWNLARKVNQEAIPGIIDTLKYIKTGTAFHSSIGYMAID
jgi:hypothetical protein